MSTGATTKQEYVTDSQICCCQTLSSSIDSRCLDLRLATRTVRFGPEADSLTLNCSKKTAEEFQRLEKRGAIERPKRVSVDSIFFLFKSLRSTAFLSLKFLLELFSIFYCPKHVGSLSGCQPAFRVVTSEPPSILRDSWEQPEEHWVFLTTLKATQCS